MRQPKWLNNARDLIVPPPKGVKFPTLIFDIETSPEGNWTWGRYKQNTIGNLRPNYQLSNVYTWHGTGEYHFIGQNQDPKYIPDNPYRKPRRIQDRWVLAQMWHLFDMAEIVVAHNGNKFDIPFVNGRMMHYHVAPPSPFASIDTLAVVKKHARFASNRLNDLGYQLLNDTKKQHYGISTWLGCMAGDLKMWEMMEAYNLQDVVLLEELYELLIPWIKRPKHLAVPNANRWMEGKPVECPFPGCGGEKLWARKKRTTGAGLTYRQYQCQKCEGYFKGSYAERSLTPVHERVQ